MSNQQYHIESFCREHGIETPMFWNLRRDGNDLYAVSLHLHANDRWEEFDARAVFVLFNCSDGDSQEAEKTLLLQMFKELGEPLVLTIKDSVSPNKQRFFKEYGMIMAPVRWSDNEQSEYIVYTKGNIEMGGFVNLMEHVEFIGKEVIYRQ